MNKKLIINNDKITISIEPCYCTNITTITKKYENKKVITFSIWDDISIYGITRNEKEILEFEFNDTDLLYYNLNRLLKGNELIIDDDGTYGDMKKYMIIKKENED